MLKLEKSQYLNFLCLLNFTKYKKKLCYKIVYCIKIHKFESQYSSIRCIFFILIKNNTIQNSKLNFLTIICEIRKKRKNAKLFTSMRSTNVV